MSNLTSGVVSISKDSGTEETFEINGGVIEMQDNKIIVLAN